MNNRIGLTLSGGGIRGIAHLGVLQYLDELNIKPSIISATSAGSLVGVFYLAGFSPEEIFDISKTEKFFNRNSLLIRNGGLFSPEVFSNIAKKYIPHDTIEKLNIPIYITATDLTNAKLVVFLEGSIAFAVKSSCCVPLVFQPVEYNGSFLTDGGLLNNLPVDLIETKCDKVIGVNVNSISKMEGKVSYQRITERTIQIVINKNAEDKKNKCDVYIAPPGMEKYKIFDFKKMDEIYQIGYTCAKDYKDELLKL
ncbi:patatin-like phospholipase family protein [Flavobacterium sp. CS20]|uniref:patatin-like phospholipase family protein n=1 Tax=Flavobacterium sp. CS20 TaxID=2775246 RepID=UPI001B39D178|nr:patatin-like phospholipase family protein [Flavobacterium sp. CS20]QTY27144.1 patatin-like phospholipase family protein [Flavobacterium sp. CS20]